MGAPGLTDSVWLSVHAHEHARPPAEIRSLTAAFCPVSGDGRFVGGKRARSTQ